jgi:hypothetical protein
MSNRNLKIVRSDLGFERWAFQFGVWKTINTIMAAGQQSSGQING